MVGKLKFVKGNRAMSMLCASLDASKAQHHSTQQVLNVFEGFWEQPGLVRAYCMKVLLGLKDRRRYGIVDGLRCSESFSLTYVKVSEFLVYDVNAARNLLALSFYVGDAR